MYFEFTHTGAARDGIWRIPVTIFNGTVDVPDTDEGDMSSSEEECSSGSDDDDG
jgi:hypothetical protein